MVPSAVPPPGSCVARVGLFLTGGTCSKRSHRTTRPNRTTQGLVSSSSCFPSLGATKPLSFCFALKDGHTKESDTIMMFHRCCMSIILASISAAVVFGFAPHQPPSFGGLMIWSDVGQCPTSNPYTNDCNCLPGTQADLGFPHPNVSGINPLLSTVLCYGAVPGSFQGAFMRNPSTGQCETVNRFTNACTCPTSANTTRSYRPFSNEKYSVTFCFGSESDVYFGGVYDDGEACEANPLAGDTCACSTPANQPSSFSGGGSEAVMVCTFACWSANTSSTCGLFPGCSWCGSSPTNGTCAPTAPPGQLSPTCCVDDVVYETCGYECCDGSRGGFCCPYVNEECCYPDQCGSGQYALCDENIGCWCGP